MEPVKMQMVCNDYYGAHVLFIHRIFKSLGQMFQPIFLMIYRNIYVVEAIQKRK